MDWSLKTVLVTGAGGFIGSHLTERLLALGANTRALVRYNSSGGWGWLDTSAVRNEIQVVAGDIRDPDSIKKAFQSVDIVFHLAALIGIPYSYSTPLAYVRTNIEGTLNVLQLARDSDVGLTVHTSTSEVYGTARYVPIDESHPLQGQSPYSASKIGADCMVESYHRSFGLPVATIRPFNTYGPRQSDRAIVPTIITQALTASEIRLGNMNPTRDLTYVADTVEAYVRFATSPNAVGQVINVGSGQEISIRELAETVLRLAGRDVPIMFDNERARPERSEVERLCANNDKALQILDWRPERSLQDGLTDTISWVKEHLDRFRVGVYAI
jgi:dTDP-glucose 4,6-dehydratase